MTSLYATIAPHFTQDLLSPGLRVGYYDEGGVWQFLAPSIAQRLPLRAIEWKNLVGVTQTIDRLPLHFVARPENESTLPLVCIYVIKCEDMDRYKTTVKPQIAQWIDRMNATKVDWMLLYVPLGTRAKRGSSGHAGIHTTHSTASTSGSAGASSGGGGGGGSGGGSRASGGIYKRIFEKIKSDFAHKKSTSSSLNTGSSSSGGGSGGGGGSMSGGGGGGGSGSGSSAGGGGDPPSSSLRSSAGGAASSAITNLSNLGSSLAGIGGGGAANGVSVDRICKIDMMEGASVVGAQSTNETQWSELILKLKKSIMEAFQCKCLQYEEEVRVLDAKRSLPNWDFGAFFVAKERLALMYQQTCLLDDAIRHLDELEAIFGFLIESDKRFQTPVQASPPLTTTDPIFTVSALAVDLPAMQQQIAAGRASPLLMRLYFFSRQIRTLYLMGDFRQLITRAVTFISSFHELLQHEQEQPHSELKWFQPHLWASGACLEIAYACELSWSGHDYQISSASIPEGVSFALTPEIMAGLLGDILYLARRVLKKSARTNGWWTMAPSSHNSTGSETTALAVEPVASSSSSSSSSWYSSLETMFEAATPDQFQRCVWELSHLASLHFSRAGRHRFAVFLGGECARYHARHRELESASRLFRSHARQCEEDKWWTLTGDCVRRICDCELALGRSAQAVAACFSMLEIAQASNAEVSRAYLEQLLSSLVQSLERSNDDDNDSEVGADGTVVHQETGGSSGRDRVKMGELIKPAMAIETMQCPSSDLDYGDVRVTLSLTNQFPAGIHIESVRIRFTKCDVATDDQEAVLSGSARQGETDQISDELLAGICLDASDAPSASASESASANDDDHQHEHEHESETDALVELVENNVYLYQRASVNLVFLYGDVDVGHYECSGLECAVAGNTFPLFSKRDLASIRFEIPPRKSTLQLRVDGPPLLTPASVAEIRITIDTEDDDVAHGGVLEVALPDDCEAVSLSHAQLHTTNATAPVEMAPSQTKKCTLVIPKLAAKTRVSCSVWLVVASTTTTSEDSVVVPLAASLRYEIHTAAKRHTELRRCERAFCVLRPLEATPRITRIDATRAFVALTLQCNSDCGLWIRDYALCCDPTSESVVGEGEMPSSALRVVQDPNGHVRDHHLAPNETLHMAFGLCMDSDTHLPVKAVLRVNIEFDEEFKATATTTRQDGWRTVSLIDIPLQSLQGSMYQIDIQPKAAALSQEFSMGEDVVFHVTVRQLRNQGTNNHQHSESEQLPQPQPAPLLLCLDPTSEQEWILLGKQHERFAVDDKGRFTTTRRLLPLHVGRLRVPQFQLRYVSSAVSSEAHGVVPSEQVYCAQRAMALLVV